jgi:hypothetical protein
MQQEGAALPQLPICAKNKQPSHNIVAVWPALIRLILQIRTSHFFF